MIASFKNTIFLVITISASINFIHANEDIRLGELLFYFTSNSQIPKTMIYTIKTDDSGKVWAGSWGGGLGVFDGNTWKAFTTDNSGLPSNTINEIVFDLKNALWVGTDSGLVKYDGLTWTVFTPQNSPMAVFHVGAIAVDRQNNVWFDNGYNSEGGLMFLSGNEWKLFTPDDSVLPASIINDILIDSSNTVWVATWVGLVMIDGTSWKFFNKNNSIMPYNWVDELALDNRGTIWVGQSLFVSSDSYAGALMTISHGCNTWSFNNPSQTGKASKNIKAITCDKRGYIWVSTGPGDSIGYYAVSIFNKKQWVSFTLSKNDTSRIGYIPEIAVDKNNNVWFATEVGIIVLKQDTLAIDSLFSKSGVGVKHEFKQNINIRQQQGKTAYHDLLGRKSLKTGENVKKTNGVLIESDNLHAKKVLKVK